MCLLVALAASPAHAQFTLHGIDGLSSTVMQEGQTSFTGLGLRAQVKASYTVPSITFLPTFEWFRVASNIQPYDVKSVRKDAALGLDARWEFEHPGWRPYVGVGYSVHFIGAELEAPSLGVPHDSYGVTKGGASVLGGVIFTPTGRLHNFLELKYHHLPPYRQLKFNWGLSWML
jgi:hypothetical protein